MHLTRRRFIRKCLLLLGAGWLARHDAAAPSARPEPWLPAYAALERRAGLSERVDLAYADR